MVARELPGSGSGQAFTVTVHIESGLAYEFLMSLGVFSDVEGDTKYGSDYVGKGWFEDIRANVSPDLLETIEQFSFHSYEIWEHLLGLAYTCPAPRDVPTLLATLEAIDPLELRLHLLGYYVREHRRVTPPDVIYAAAQGDAEAQKKLLRTSFPDDPGWQKMLRWLLSLEKAATKERLLDIARGWYSEVFREKEALFASILERDVEAKRALQTTLSPEELIAACTGWEYAPEPGIQRVVLVPSYMLRPYSADANSADTRIFFYPVADESINADASAPPVRLLRLAKALADERRLRILKKLSGGSYTLQEIADEFGVAKTTIHHHLIHLRTAGLVRMRMSDKRYSLRQDAVDQLGDLLSAYLAKSTQREIAIPTFTVSPDSPLRRPAFLRLWSGLVISRMGDQFTLVALIWFVLQLTGSGLAIGLVALCFQLPNVVSSPMLGKLLDRFSPRVVMSIDNFGRAVIIACIPLLFWLGMLHLWMVYTLALCAGLLSPATEIGMRLLIPRLVSDAALERANALSSVSWDFATLVGPAAAGFLVLITSAPGVLLIDSATFLFMGAMVLTLPAMQRKRQDKQSSQGEKAKRAWLGFGTIVRMKTVLFLAILTLLFLFVQGLAEVAIPVFSQQTLHAGSSGYGLLMSSNGAGALLALALVSQIWTRHKRPGMSLAAILLLSGLLLLPFIIIRSLPFALLVMLLAGFAAAPYYVVEQSLTQRLVPESLRGQVFGARGSINVAGYPLGSAVGGALLGVMAAPWVIGVAGVLSMTIGSACVLSPAMRNLPNKLEAVTGSLPTRSSE